MCSGMGKGSTTSGARWPGCSEPQDVWAGIVHSLALASKDRPLTPLVGIADQR
jgi:hypothetical protein